MGNVNLGHHHTVSINVSRLEPGPKNGFLLLLDPMMSTSLNLGVEKRDVNSTEDDIREVLSKGPQLESLAELHILNALKAVSGSASFLAQSEEKKDCGNEDFEICQSHRYLVAVEQQCGCIPWLATFFLEHKVMIYNHNSIESLFLCISILLIFNFLYYFSLY